MAVYTEVSNEDLAAFLSAYHIGTVTSYKGIEEGVENSNYLLFTQAGRYILTLFEKRVAERDLPFFLGLMEHLAGRGIACPLPLRGANDQPLHRLSGRPAAIVTFLEGMWPKRIHPHHCRELGAALARMHLAGSDFPMQRENDLSLAGWTTLVAQCRDRADSVAPGLAEALERELAMLADAWPRDLPRGVIHADLFPDNVFFIGEELTGLIDFYFACTDAFAYDWAICLNAWCFEPDGAFNVTKARLMLASYRRVRPFSDAELAALPVLARGAAVRFLLTRLHDWLNHPAGAFVRPKDPLEYWRKLRFHQGVTGLGGYGLD